MSLASSIESSPVWGFLQVLWRFFQSLVTDMEYTAIVPVLQSVDQSFVGVLQAWTSDYGIMTPTVMVVSMGVTFIGLYLVFFAVAPMRDMVGE